jgi:hypothetical protein
MRATGGTSSAAGHLMGVPWVTLPQCFETASWRPTTARQPLELWCRQPPAVGAEHCAPAFGQPLADRSQSSGDAWVLLLLGRLCPRSPN